MKKQLGLPALLLAVYEQYQVLNYAQKIVTS